MSAERLEIGVGQGAVCDDHGERSSDHQDDAASGLAAEKAEAAASVDAPEMQPPDTPPADVPPTETPPLAEPLPPADKPPTDRSTLKLPKGK